MMKKIVTVIVLAVLLQLAVVSASYAAPPANGPTGSYKYGRGYDGWNYRNPGPYGGGYYNSGSYQSYYRNNIYNRNYPGSYYGNNIYNRNYRGSYYGNNYYYNRYCRPGYGNTYNRGQVYNRGSYGRSYAYRY